MMHGIYGGWQPGWEFFGFPFFSLIFGIALLALVVYLIVLIVKKLRYNGYQYNQNDPLTIVKRRYARGEISREEYEAIRKEPQEGL